MDDVERLLIERACERLIVSYSHLIDFGEAGRVGELFTGDGVWESAEATMSGRDQITAGFGRRQSNASRRSRHVCTNVAIDVDSGDEAHGVCYFTLYRRDGVDEGGAPLEGQPQIVGEYRDHFVRTAEGWRISHRVATVGFTRS